MFDSYLRLGLLFFLKCIAAVNMSRIGELYGICCVFFVYKVRQYSDIGGVSVLLLHANFRQLARLW